MWAQKVSQEEAMQRAYQFLTKSASATTKGMKKAPRKAPRMKVAEANDCYYIFNDEANGGFIIVSGDERTSDILGYGTHGSFDADDIPANVRAWLDGYAAQIRALSPSFRAEANSEQPTHPVIIPLIETTWNQDAPYNRQCPTVNGEYCVTGCVATAMAQVMNYHLWPQGMTTEIPAYDLVTETLPATQFDWANMQNDYSYSYSEEAAAAVATLMRYCGQAVEMQYGTDESGAPLANCINALKTYFGYDNTMSYVERDTYSEADWDNLIYTELQAGRPVLYGGYQTRKGGGGGWIVDAYSYSDGHAFVCDGYDGAGYYHINWGWGWGGYYDGFFKLAILAPEGSGIGGGEEGKGYQYAQHAVIGIQPPGGVPTHETVTLNCTATITLPGSHVTHTPQPVALHITNNGAAFERQPVVLYATEQDGTPQYVYGERLSMKAHADTTLNIQVQFSEAGSIALSLQSGDDVMGTTTVEIAEAFNLEMTAFDSDYTRQFNAEDNTFTITVENKDTRTYNKRIEVCIYPMEEGIEHGKTYRSSTLSIAPGEQTQVTIPCEALDMQRIYLFAVKTYINPNSNETYIATNLAEGEQVVASLHFADLKAVNRRWGVPTYNAIDSKKNEALLRYPSYRDKSLVLPSEVTDEETGIVYKAIRNDHEFQTTTGNLWVYVDEGYTTLSDGAFLLPVGHEWASVDNEGNLYNHSKQTFQELYLPSTIRYLQEELIGGCPDFHSLYINCAEPPVIVGNGQVSKNLLYTKEPQLYDQVTLYVPTGCKSKYEDWSHFKHIEEFDFSTLPPVLKVRATPDTVCYGDTITMGYAVEGGELHGQPDVKCILDNGSWTEQQLTADDIKTLPRYTHLAFKLTRGTIEDKFVILEDNYTEIQAAPLYLTVDDKVVSPWTYPLNFPVKITGFRNGDTPESVFLGREPQAWAEMDGAYDTPWPLGIWPIKVQGVGIYNARNYNQICIDGKLYVEYSIDVTADDKTMTYGDTIPTLTYTTSSGMELWGEPELTTTATRGSGAGTYPIKTGRGTVQNRRATFYDAVLTIGKAPLTVSVENVTITEGDDIPDFALTYDGFRNDDTEESAFKQKPVVICSATKDSPSGTYPITITAGDAANYNVTYKNATLTILRNWQPATVTADDKLMAYGDDVPELTYTAEGGELDGTPHLATSATKRSNAGTYNIAVSKGTVQNPKATFANGTLTIEKAPLTIAARTYTKEQGQPMPALELDYTGFKNSQTEKTSSVFTTKPVVSCEATVDSEPGEYIVTVSGAEARNYEISYVAGKLIVTEATPVTITAANYTRKYGNTNPIFGYTSEGAPLNGRPELTCEATPESPVGVYPIIIKKGGVKNYNDTYVNGTLTIEPAPLTASVGNYSREQGADNPVFTILYSGWKNGEDESVLTTRPTAVCEATVDSEPGDYPITVSGGEAQNYTFKYTGGVLTVTVSSGIEDILATGQPFNVYTTAGVQVRHQTTSLSSLASGLYIVNGRKVVVK